MYVKKVIFNLGARKVHLALTIVLKYNTRARPVCVRTNMHKETGNKIVGDTSFFFFLFMLLFLSLFPFLSLS